MAYAPTTWDANDVITKDKLNKIEQGINTASKLSGTDIDTDKDWNGKSITNLDHIEANRIRPVASDETRWAKSGSSSVTIPAIYTSGTVQISMSVSGLLDGGYWWPRFGTLSIDGVAKKTISAESGTNTHTGVYAVSGGSIVSFSGDGVGAVSISCSDTPPIIYPPAATWPS